MLKWGVRLEQMLLVTDQGTEVTTLFPIDEITIVD
jgi:Xaa-Pro aminopeptidase